MDGSCGRIQSRKQSKSDEFGSVAMSLTNMAYDVQSGLGYYFYLSFVLFQ